MCAYGLARVFRWRNMAAALTAVAILGPAHGVAAEPETLETVFAVWRKREADTKSVKVVTTEDSHTGEGVGLDGEALGGTQKMRCVVIIDGTNMRYERVGEATVAGREKPDHWTTFEVIDGQHSKVLSLIERDHKALHSNAWISRAEKHPSVHNIYLRPVLWHYRPLSPAFGVFNLDALKLVSTEEKVAGVRCILLEEPFGLPGGIRKYWVAPEQDMAVIRVVATWDDALNHQVDISFEKDAKKGWIPASWKATRLAKKATRILDAGTDKVTEIEINPRVPPSTFDIEFPPGTEVYNHVTRKTTVIPPAPKER